MIFLTLSALLSPLLQEENYSPTRIAWELSKEESANASPEELFARYQEFPDSLFEAATRAWVGTSQLEAFCLAGMSAAETRDAAITASAWVGPSHTPELTRELFGYSKAGKVHAMEALLQIGEGALLCDPSSFPQVTQLVVTQSQRGLDFGAGTGALVRQFPEHAARLLSPLKGRQLSKDILAGLLLVKPTDIDREAKLELSLILLDHEVHPQAQAATLGFWNRLQEPNLSGKEAQALLAGLSRHAHLLPKSAFADFTPDGGTPHAQSFILQQAPLSHTDQHLFQWLRDSQVNDQVRSAAAMRLVRGAGESWTQPVFEVLQNGVPEKVQVAIYGALRPWVGTQHTTWIAEALPKLKQESAAFATEMVLRHGSHGQRIHFASKLPRLNLKSIRTAAAKAAWDVDPSPALEQSFWEWTRTRDPETQILAQVSLIHALGPAKAAAGYHQRLAEERDPIVQNLLLENLQRMGTDEALEVFLLWLSLPQSLEHPMSGDWALRLIAEPTTVPLFRGWWDNRSSLTQDQKDAAAGALAPNVPSARAHLMERVPSFPAGKQIAFIDRLRENATSQEAEQWADWVRDPSTPLAVIGPLCAAISANESSAMQAALGLLEEIQETSHTQLPNIPATKIVQAFIATGSPLLREETLRVSLQIEERLTSRAQTLTAARLRGQVINPQETDLGTLLAQARLMLTVPTPTIHGEPHASRMKQAHPLWAILLEVLSAHGSWADQAMASFLEHPAQRDLLNPERLWMLVQGFDQKLPQAAANAKLHLRLGLSPVSLLHPSGRARTTPIKPRYWTTPESILQHLQDQFLQAPSGDEQSLAQIAACIQRWPSDRRFWNLQGWYSLAESDWQLAETSFESSMRRSGHLTSALQEPRFGLEVMRALQGGDNWPTYLNENPDAVTNLPRFLSPLRDPRFQDLLEAQ